eukprot:TRINITY_DN191_c0_g1_i1.p1 TRINITY_DN191_c0_g1~~TRINITY_DN191_c0_g1_i1.p1  ORF type:complete len:192 (-),score=91.08 TRINITY_DN191_c0_g1_i1:50-625(-)
MSEQETREEENERLDGMIQEMESIGQESPQGLQAKIDKAADKMLDMFVQTEQKAENVAEDAKEVMGEASEKVKENMEEASEKVKENMEEASEKVKEGMGEASEKVKEGMEDGIEQGKETLGMKEPSTTEKIKAEFDSMIHPEEQEPSTKEVAKQALTQAKESIQETGEAVKEFVLGEEAVAKERVEKANES